MCVDADVVVVGAGPAGATAARELARRGASVLALERARMPRYKCCAGGIPVRTAAALDFPIDSVIEDTISGLHLTHLGQLGFARWSRQPIAFMVMRDRLDALLVEQARAAGARVEEGITVRGVQRDGDGFRVLAGEDGLRCRVVLGADGANSVTGRALGLGHGLATSVALEAEVRGSLASLGRWRGVLNLDVGYRPWGYAWLFPKETRLSIGIVLPPGRGPQIRAELQGYLTRLGLSGAPVERLAGHKILFRRGHEPIAGDGMALLGDAAGLADEFGEEGIYYAIRSGQLAARHVARALGDGRRCLGSYQRAVDRTLMPELRAARILARLFYGAIRSAPWLTFRLSRHLPYLWQALFRVLRGESSYASELGRGPFLPAIATTLLRGARP